MSVEKEKPREQTPREKLISLKKELIFLYSVTEGSSGNIDEYSDYASRKNHIRQEISTLESSLSEEEKKSVEREVQVSQLEGSIRILKQTGWSNEEINAVIQKLEHF